MASAFTRERPFLYAVTPEEQTRRMIDATCKGCGQRMRVSQHWGRRTCSDRCAQRDCRIRRRMAPGLAAAYAA